MRCNRLVSRDLSERFCLARGWLREVLAGYCGCLARDIAFGDNGYGKPYLIDYPELNFNLSHSKQWVAIAVTSGNDVGVDVQYADNGRRLWPIVDRYFAAEERLWLQDLPDERFAQAFYQLWSLKEAFVKAVGLGMRLPFDTFAFSRQDDGGFDIGRLPCGMLTAGWGLWSFESLQPDCALAVVSARRDMQWQLQC